MTNFVHLDYSTTHPGVARIESALDAAQRLRTGFSGTRGLAKFLLSAVVAAVMVVAYEVMDSVAEGHLLVLWTSVWAVAFVAMAAFASGARRMATRVRAGLDAWSRSIAEAKADERLWRIAKADARVMADLQAAMTRRQADGETGDLAQAAPFAPSGLGLKTASTGDRALRAYQRQYI